MNKPFREVEILEPEEIDIDEFNEISKEVISKNFICKHLATNFELLIND